MKITPAESQMGTAILVGDIDKVRALIEQGVHADTLLLDYDEPTPLLVHAAIHNKVEVAKMLVEAGADVNQTRQPAADPKPNYRHSQVAPLHYAATRANLPFVKLLVDHGADVNASSATMHSPLFSALQSPGGKKSLEVIRYLLDHGADPATTPTGRNLLSCAALNKMLRGAITELIRQGANPNALDEWAATPLRVAIKEGNARAVEELLAGGADPQLRWPKSEEPWSEKNALEFAKRKKKILSLLEQGASN